MSSNRKLLTAAVAAALGASDPAAAATITVASLSDDPLTINVQCRLRDAITAANTDTPAGACDGGDENDTIVFNLTGRAPTVTLVQGELEVTSAIDIDGRSLQGGTVTVSGNNASRLFRVFAGGNLSLENLRLTEGNAGAGLYGGAVRNSGSFTANNVDFENNSAEEGGAFWTSGIFAISNSTLTNNTASRGGGLALISGSGGFLTGSTVTLNQASGSRGGGIFSRGQLSVSGSTISGNSAADQGGGIALDFTGGGASLNLDNSTLADNIAGTAGAAAGGGIFSDAVSLNVSNSVISGNSAAFAGGLFLFLQAGDPATISLENTTVSGNTGTALVSYGDLQITNSTISGNSGGTGTVVPFDSTATLTNTTVSSNTSLEAAIYGVDATLSLVNSTLLNNSPNGVANISSLAMTNSVIAGSSMTNCDGITSKTIDINNLIEDGSCADGAVNRLAGDPQLGPLQDNGGPTATHAPLSGSVLIEGGSDAECPATDQTGVDRPVDGNANGNARCDIGAVEFVDAFPPVATLTPIDPITAEGATSLAVAVNYIDEDANVDFTSIDTQDISVLPGPLEVTGLSLSLENGGITGTYSVTPPGGSWDGPDSGRYVVHLNGSEVFDTATTGANAVRAGELGTFDVVITEIDVQGNGMSISAGDNSPSGQDGTAFGDVGLTEQSTAAFTITNLGGGTLALTGAVEVLGAGFSTTQPSATALAGGQSTTFEVTFAPEALGSSAGVITIPNDDDNENPYTFAVSGSGVEGTTQDFLFADGFETQ